MKILQDVLQSRRVLYRKQKLKIHKPLLNKAGVALPGGISLNLEALDGTFIVKL